MMASKAIDYGEALFKGIFDSSLDAIITINDLGVIETFNEAAEKLFGYKPKEAIGKNVKLLMPDPYCSEHDHYLQRYQETSQRKIIGIGREVQGRKKDGSVFAMHLSVNEAQILDRRVFVGFARDITLIKSLEKELAEKTRILERQMWLRDMQLKLHKAFRGEKQREKLCQDILASVVEVTSADVGVFYFMENNELYFVAGHAFPADCEIKKTLKIGEGISGLAASTNKIQVLEGFDKSNLVLEASTQTLRLKSIMAVPLFYTSDILGVIEIGAKNAFLKDSLEFMEQTREAIAISLSMVLTKEELRYMINQEKLQADKIRYQSQSLREKNEELAQQTEELQSRQEEIEQNNEELQEQRAALEEQTKQLEESNFSLEESSKQLLQKTQALEKSNKYKSEFLANMSHELRTPLNSILVLSQILMENKSKKLDDNQVKSADTIYKCGNDLLSLINDILDLSKVEANRMEINFVKVYTRSLLDNLHTTFDVLLAKKDLSLSTKIAKNFPKSFVSDPMRLEQILRNFLSNSIKFTDKGKISIHCHVVSDGAQLVFSVIDTGIGIPKEKLEDIFGAFQQVDGSAARSYGGTGLGLAISTKLATLMNGEIKVESTVGKGSQFSLIIPSQITQKCDVDSKNSDDLQAKEQSMTSTIGDDREHLEPNKKTLLIIEDDLDFAKILLDFARKNHFQVLHTATGKFGLSLAEDYLPDGIILERQLSEMDGISLLKALKENQNTRFIPTHVMEVRPCKGGTSKQQLLQEANIFFNKLACATKLTKYDGENSSLNLPIVLLVDDDERNIFTLRQLFASLDVLVMTATNGKDAIELFKEYPHTSLIIMDMMMPVMDGFAATVELRKLNKSVPIIALTAKAMKEDKDACLKSGCTDYIAKPVNTKQLLSLVKLWLG